MNIKTEFATRLRDLREAQNLSQEDIANILKISRAAISSYEHGKRVAGIDVLVKFADFFDCTTDFLLGRANPDTVKSDIERFAEQSGLSEKVSSMFYNRYVFNRYNRLEHFNCLVENELPPTDVSEYLIPEDFDEDTFDAGDLTLNPDYFHAPVLSEFIDCVNADATRNKVVNNLFKFMGVAEDPVEQRKIMNAARFVRLQSLVEKYNDFRETKEEQTLP